MAPKLAPFASGTPKPCGSRSFIDHWDNRDGTGFVFDEADERAGQEFGIAANSQRGQGESRFDERGAFGGELPQAGFTRFLCLEGFERGAMGDLAIDQVNGLMEISQNVGTIGIRLHATSLSCGLRVGVGCEDRNGVRR